MKTRTSASILIFLFTISIIIGGCASTILMIEPEAEDSSLLVGRITLTCTNFPAGWKMNTNHTQGITVYIRNLSTNKTVKARSSGDEGFFAVVDLDEGDYLIDGFTIDLSGTTSRSRYKIKLGHQTNDNASFKIQNNAVNNLGDITWYANYETEEYSQEWGKSSTTSYFNAKTSHSYEHNYSDLKTWFRTKYPDSAWSGKNWINI